MKKLVLAVVALMIWAGAMAQVPRAEYPRPQMERAELFTDLEDKVNLLVLKSLVRQQE